MKHNHATVQQWIGLSEGGYVNHPDDPGGATDRGITQRTFDSWRRSRGEPTQPVRGISQAEAEQIIAEQYFAPVWFDRLPSGLDYAMADYSVNSGPARAVKELQRILGVVDDGVMGNVTFAAILGRRVADLIIALCARRMAFLRALDHWPTFGTGWKIRVMGRQDGVQTSDIGVIDRAVRLSKAVANIPAPTAVGAGRAPEPKPESTAMPAVASGGGAIATTGTALTAASGLHPVAQGILIGGVLVLIVAAAVWWHRAKRNKAVAA